jgi:putative membrane protein
MDNKWINISIRGLAMGMAEVVPGVSGGTIAFITGIYEELLISIKAFHPRLFKIFRDEGLAKVWQEIHGSFLVALLFGMAVGLVIGVFGISWLIEHEPKAIWSFFFGLIIASAAWVAKSSDTWYLKEWIGFLVATIIAFSVTVISPASGIEDLWFVFISGIIAISAMLLPGISGSFLLLLMGMYTFIISNVKEVLRSFQLEHLIVVGTFALGCLIGLAGAARALTWVFQHFRNLALAILTGFMLGSLNRLWPWKIVESFRLNSQGEEVPLVERSILPTSYAGDPQILTVILCALAGFMLVWLLGKVSPKAEDTSGL